MVLLGSASVDGSAARLLLNNHSELAHQEQSLAEYSGWHDFGA